MTSDSQDSTKEAAKETAEESVSVLRGAFTTAMANLTPMLAAGMAFFAFMSLFPALIAGIVLYGLFADPDTITRNAESVTSGMPEDAKNLVLGQFDKLAQTSSGALSLSLLVSLGAAFWAASGAFGNLGNALNVAYGCEETRGFVPRKLLALGFTLMMIIAGLVLVLLAAGFPAMLYAVDIAPGMRVLAEVGRWLVMIVLVSVGLMVAYRVLPDHDSRHEVEVRTGAITAAVALVVASIGFSIYVSTFGNYGQTYGSLSAVVVLMMWMWIGFLVILLGAHINAQIERKRGPLPVVKDPPKREGLGSGQR